MEVRAYLPSDRDACIELYDTSAAELEPTHPRKSFETFLLSPPPSFYVLEHENKILGCGGFEHPENSPQARLIWGMVHSSWRRQGLGRFLLMYRLRELTKSNTVQFVQLEVPSHLAAFYQRQGFHVAAQLKDAYAPGINRIELSKRLTVCE